MDLELLTKLADGSALIPDYEAKHNPAAGGKSAQVGPVCLVKEQRATCIAW
jgi:hypothetical protein